MSSEQDDPFSHDPLLQRLERLRDASSRAEAPEALWERVQLSIASAAAAEHGTAPRSRWTRGMIAAAASALLTVGFAGGWAAAHGWPRATERPTASIAPEIAVQRSGTELVHALDALAAHQVSVTPAALAAQREVAVVALGAVIAAGSSEYPAEVRELVAALMPSETVGRTSSPPQ
jgi:hypothetical protein